jgi:uncharacterized membrane protein
MGHPGWLCGASWGGSVTAGPVARAPLAIMPAMQIGPPGLAAAAAQPLPPEPPATAYVAPTQALRQARGAALALCAALAALCLIWELVLAPTGRGTLAIKALPLLLALPGLWRWRLYTARWLALVVWLYVIEGLVRAWSDRGLGRPLAVVEVVLAVALFVACGLQIRWRLRAGHLADAAAAADRP